MIIKKTENITKDIEIEIPDGLHHFKIQTEDSDECSYFKVFLTADKKLSNLTTANYTKIYLGYDEISILRGRNVSVYWKIEDWFTNSNKQPISITEFEEKYNFAKNQI